jgi:hypothetical protein
VEGQVLMRHFPHATLGMSALESMRNYENLIKSLGGVKVNQLMPADAEFRRLYPESPEVLEKKTRVLGLNNGGFSLEFSNRLPVETRGFGLLLFISEALPNGAPAVGGINLNQLTRYLNPR